MKRTGYIRTYRGYDIYRNVDPPYGETWYAALAHSVPGHQNPEALTVYPDERSLRRDIDATFIVPRQASEAPA